MLKQIRRQLSLSTAAILIVQLVIFSPMQLTPENSDGAIELNFVFLHGMGSTPCTLQLLSDQIMELLPVYTAKYKIANPNATIEVNTLSRCYPGYVDIHTWANNIADGINTHFRNKDNIILVGHSMGGKTALYAVANNIGNISERVAAVVTINSPVRSLSQYYVPGGGPMVEYCRTTLLGSDEGVCTSLANYDSSQDGAVVSQTKHWLAFISSEPAPLSPYFDRAGVDPWPRNMDDGTVPLPAQFSKDADVVYYGKYGHSDISTIDVLSRSIANQILRYIFGESIECSVVARNGSFKHEADWLLGTDHWTDIVGGILASSGKVEHTNDSFYKWQEWEDVIVDYTEGDKRAYSHVRLSSLSLITNIKQAAWLDAANVSDLRINLQSQAAPLTSIRIDWAIYKSGLFSPGEERTFYDIEMSEGTPLAGIRFASWMSDEQNDPVLWIWSEAQSPFRWFKARWQIYQKERRWGNIIDEIKSREALD
ncbi:esterase/lipase family protein [Chloroflexota bacterium]